MSALQIETARLRLRLWTREDLDELHRMWTDPQVRKYLWDDQIIARELAEEVIASSLADFAAHGLPMLAIYEKKAEPMIGFCGLRFFGEEKEVEILYGLYPSYWGRGYATEAARAMLRYGFEKAKCQRLYAGTDPPNAGSIRVMERLGMVFDKRIQVNGQEAVYYVMERESYQAGEFPYGLPSSR